MKVEYYEKKSYARKFVDGKFRQIIGSCEKYFRQDIVNRLIPYIKKGVAVPELYRKRGEIFENLKNVG